MTTITDLGPAALVRELAAGRLGIAEDARAIARCVEAILSGDIAGGICALAMVTGEHARLLARPSARRITAAMGLGAALDAAIEVVDGNAPGAPHAWVARGMSGFTCKACGAVVARHHGEPICPHDAVADELERMQ